MQEQIYFTSNKKGQDVTLKSLIDKSQISFVVAKIIEVCIKEKQYIGSSQQTMKIFTQNKIIEIFNKRPGIVDELYIKANDIITVESVLFTLSNNYQDIQILDIKYANPIKKHPIIRINIINQNQSCQQIENNMKQEKQTSFDCNFKSQIENHSQIVLKHLIQNE